VKGLTVLLILASCLLVGDTAYAQMPDSPYERALSQSLAAHARGDYATARTFMEEAHALEPSARTLRGLGIIAHAEGRLVEAVAPLEASLTSTVRPLTPALRSTVQELLGRVLAQVARVRLTLVPSVSTVQVDGREPVLHGRDEILLSPGSHHIDVRAPGRAPHALVLDAQPGTVETVHVVLAPEPTREVLPPATLPPPSAPLVVPVKAASAHDLERTVSTAVREHWWSPRRRNLVLAGGGAGVLLSATLLIAAWRKFERLDADCRALPAGGCTRAEAEQRFDDARVRPLAHASVVVGVLGMATLSTALVIELVQRRTRADVHLSVSPQNVTLEAKF